ncbi:MAG: hypothetical protein NZ700_11805 [Gemmataceae bacterium]|nr:hypothetical protein [Gemmataceae bacterium]MDW8266849.1 hypothetical protein [Gemmataceae bacterium]
MSNQPPGREVLVWLLPYIMLALETLHPQTSADLGWQLRTGAWVMEHGTVPETDPFCWTSQGRRWVAYSWLYGVVLHSLYQTGGLFAILVARVGLAVAIAASLQRLIARHEPRPLVGVTLLTLAVGSLGPLFTDRPWLVTILFSTWTLSAILELRAGHAAAWWLGLLPPVYVLWANTHIQFVYGLGLLSLGCLAGAVEWLRGQGGWLLGRLLGLTAACSLATLATPYHYQLYGVVLEYATQRGAYQWVEELRAPRPTTMLWGEWLGVVLASWGVVAVLRRRSLFAGLLLAAGMAAFLHSRRDLWLLVLASVAAVLAAPARPASAGPAPVPALRWHRIAFGAVVAGLFVVLGSLRGLTPDRLEAALASRYPVGAAAWLQEQTIPGPLYNDFDWGGFLIWRLPRLPVCIDGRTNLHGDARLRRNLDVWSNVADPFSDPDLAQARVVLGPATAPLTAQLRQEPDFRVVYDDGLATVLVRKSE